jgi:hypothetical protein
VTVGEHESQVRLLVQQLGADLRVVAVSSSERAAATAASLNEARRTLAARGIRLRVDLHVGAGE